MNSAIAANADVKKTLEWMKSRIEEAGGKSTVVSEWRSGTKWYRKWSSGFIEQGGFVKSGDNQGLLISLNTPFKTTDYYATANSTYAASTDRGWGYVRDRTTSSFLVVACEPSIYWYACGY